MFKKGDKVRYVGTVENLRGIGIHSIDVQDRIINDELIVFCSDDNVVHLRYHKSYNWSIPCKYLVHANTFDAKYGF